VNCVVNAAIISGYALVIQGLICDIGRE